LKCPCGNIFQQFTASRKIWCTSLISLRSARIAPRKTTGWKRAFDDPIPLPRGRHLVTLEDAGNYITRPAPAEHEAAKWQAAMEALMLVATHGGPPMFARIGIMPALKRNVAREFNPDRKDTPVGGAASSSETCESTNVGAGDCRRPDCRQAPSGRAQAIDLQAAILVALRKLDGGTVVGEGAPAR
jgi:hypothetical protein